MPRYLSVGVSDLVALMAAHREAAQSDRDPESFCSIVCSESARLGGPSPLSRLPPFPSNESSLFGPEARSSSRPCDRD